MGNALVLTGWMRHPEQLSQATRISQRDLEWGSEPGDATTPPPRSWWRWSIAWVFGVDVANKSEQERSSWLCPPEEDPYQVIDCRAPFELLVEDQCARCQHDSDSDSEDTASCGTELMDPLGDDALLDSDCSFVSEVSVEEREEDDDDDQGKCQNECEQDLERLMRMTTCESMACVRLRDYLCLCGNCPSLRRIVKQVHALASSEDNTTKDQSNDKSLVKLLVAFSVYDEQQVFRREMISSARACLALWSGDEDQAFRSFVILHDEALYAHMMTLQL